MGAIVAGLAVHVRQAAAAAGDITTVAGTGSFVVSSGSAGDGGPPLAADLLFPYGVATSSGRSFLSQDGTNSDFSRVKMVQNGVITTVAGGSDPPLNDGAPATQASIASPASVITDAAGNIYIADSGRNRVRKVDAVTGLITTIAGASVCPTLNTCTTGISGDGGPAAQAMLDRPYRLAFDGAGNLYVATLGDYGDTGSLNRIRKIDAATGIITTVAGGGSPADGVGDGGLATDAQFSPYGLAVDPAGDIYISDQDHQTIRRVDAVTRIITTVAGDGNGNFAGDGGPATAAELLYPAGIALDRNGNLYIADSGNCRIRKVDTSGIMSTLAGTSPGGFQQCGYSGDGGPAISANLNQLESVDVDAAGNVYIDDTADSRIRKVDTSGTITTVIGNGTPGFLGDGGPATAAEISAGGGTTVDPAGRLLLADTGNQRIRAVDGKGTITTVAGGGVGDGLPATSAYLSGPRGVATNASGDLFIADCGNNRVRKVDSSGVITTVAGTAASRGLGDGGPATSAGLVCPTGLAAAGGNLYIADSVDNRVRRVDPSGIITTVAGTGAAGFSGDGGAATAAQLNQPSGVVVDAAGNLYIADHDNNRVRKVDTRGRITTVAGNGTSGGGVDGVAATTVPVVWPVGLAIGSAGNVAIAESGFARVRSVNTAGIISTIAGNGIPGYSGDGGPGPLATLDEPMGLAYDAAGNLLIADNQNLVIRSVAPGTPPPPPPVSKKTANCGMTVTQNLTLADDIGPCPGDGLVIGADGVHVNLNGHTIGGTYSHAGTSVGVRATGRQKVKISNGTITGFDAGVALISGSGNTVTGLTVANNQGNANTFNSIFGDGVVMFFSSGNIVAGNVVANNGPFDGIGMMGQGSDNNLVQNNVVKDTTNFNRPFNPGLGVGIITNPFLGFDRPRQVSLNANQIVGNTVTGNGSGGISTISNVGGVVRSNLVERNGLQSPFGRTVPGNGIGVTNARFANPNTNEIIELNQVFENGSSGIQVRSQGNRILDNVANGNGGRFAGAFFFDLDGSTFGPSGASLLCGTNVWSGNAWGSGEYNPPCASAGGRALPAGASRPAPLPPPLPQGLGDPPPRVSP
ncbi:MAG TPA: right-handed parallel beta-helix repeat-containing protein [Candidatus Dormibacteraeota bacterium]|nr:right-handed parallel beta-helix repeat-containing protein [Candidatus Dormibacteraeota bacterium]